MNNQEKPSKQFIFEERRLLQFLQNKLVVARRFPHFNTIDLVKLIKQMDLLKEMLVKAH